MRRDEAESSSKHTNKNSDEVLKHLKQTFNEEKKLEKAFYERLKRYQQVKTVPRK